MYRRRSVRCRWCNNSGHNLRGCEEHKKWLQDNPDSFYAQRENTIKENLKNRKCSYCGETKHNKKTCIKKVEQTQKLFQLNTAYRKYWFQSLKDIGAGIGSLLKKSTSTKNYNRILAQYETVENPLLLIENIKWDQVSVVEWQSENFLFGSYVNVADVSGTFSLNDIEKNVVSLLSPVEPYLEDYPNWVEQKPDSIKEFVDSSNANEVEKFLSYFDEDPDKRPQGYWRKDSPDLKKYM